MQTATMEQAPWVEEGMPTPARLGRGVLGLMALGACGALGSADLFHASQVAPAGLVVGMGSLVLTGPALLVGHQFLGLEASVGQLVGDLLGGFVKFGEMSLGLSPFLLFFAATSGLAPVLLALILPGIGAFTLLIATRRVHASELAASTEHRLARSAKIQLLLAGWSVLTGLIALRLGWGLL